jgi:hypothetical protein
MKTLLVVAAAALIVAFAATDSLRGGGGKGDSSASGNGASTLEGSSANPGPVAALPRGALAGTLWYSDALCRLERLDLTTLRQRQVAPGGGHCRFWVSPDGRYVAMHVGRPFTPPERLQLLDLRTGRVRTPFPHPDLAVAPPAWSADSRRLLVCDARSAGGNLLSLDVASGDITRLRHQACYPGFAGGRLVYRDARRDAVVVGGRRVADAARLGRLLHQGVDMVPGVAAQGRTIAVPATTIETPDGPAPHTILVFLDPSGRQRGMWDTGTQAADIGLAGGGRFALAANTGETVVLDRRSGRRFQEAIQAAAAAPDGRTLALATPLAILFTDVDSGRDRFAVRVQATWLAWTR